MNLSRFELRARPFRTTPDAQSYYPATPHESALQHLLQAIEDDEGFVLLTGETGVGKTLLGHLLLSRLGDNVTSALLTNCRFSCRADMLRALLYDLAQPYLNLGEQELRLALTDYLLAQLAAGRRTVLVLDEAQGLSPDLLEELRLLGNLETGRGKAVQIVLLAQPALAETLGRPDLVALSQRLAVRLVLEPLNIHEAADYVLHQIRVAGGRAENVITHEAVNVLAKSAGGIPRLLNQAGHLSLTIADSADADMVDVEVALEALAQLNIEAHLEADDEEAAVHLADLAAVSSERLAPPSFATGLRIPATPLPMPEFAPQTHGPRAEANYTQQPGAPPTMIYGPG